MSKTFGAILSTNRAASREGAVPSRRRLRRKALPGTAPSRDAALLALVDARLKPAAVEAVRRVPEHPAGTAGVVRAAYLRANLG
jgi:hypothetical protein